MSAITGFLRSERRRSAGRARASHRRPADRIFPDLSRSLVQERQFLAGDEIAVDRRWRQRLPGENAQITADLAVFEEWRHLLPDKETHRISTGRPMAPALTEYLLLSKRTRQVFDTEAGRAWNPSNRPR